MLIDGINLIEGADITNLTVSSGTSFPSLANVGELFFRTDAPNVGLYAHDGTGWADVGANVTYLTGTGITLDGVTFSLTPGVVTAGTYKSVTVDTYGRITLGTNPTTLTGYGITDAAPIASPTFTGTVSGITKAMVGLSSVDNTADADKPVSTAQQTALNLKLNLSGGSISGGNLIITTGSKVTLTDAPATGTDAVNKNYVDANLAGLTWKNSVRIASIANLTLSAPQTIDGVAVIANDRVLVKDQTTASQNGIYVVAAGAWTRATDMDSTTPINELNSAAVFVEQGTVNADTGWTQINAVTTLDTDNISFTQFNGAAGTTAGIGLIKTGNVLDVNLGAGIAQLPTDEVGVDLYTSGGLITTVDGSTSSTLTNAQLALATITQSTGSSFAKITLDTKGRVTGNTAVAQADITGLLGAGSITNTMLANAAVANLSGTNTGDQTITLTGGVTGSGVGSFAATVITNANLTGADVTSVGNATTLVSVGTAGTYTAVTTDAKGRVTAGNNTVAYQIFTATAAQTVFTLTSITNVVGSHRLQVFIDGIKQIDPSGGAASSYAETSTTVITFTAGVNVGSYVECYFR